MTKPIALPPIERLNELLEIVPIDPSQFGTQSGLIWKVNRRGPVRAGNVAGTKRSSKERPDRVEWQVHVDRRHYTVSRVLYLMAKGVDPGELQVDHKDRNPLNNNVGNLRLGNNSLQGHNRGLPKNNKSGAVGVTPRKNGKWFAKLAHEDDQFYLGYHTCKIEAARAYNNKVIELELDKLGKPLNDLETLKCNCSSCQN